MRKTETLKWGKGWPPPSDLMGGGVPREAGEGGNCGSPGREGRGLNVNRILSECAGTASVRVPPALAPASRGRRQPPSACTHSLLGQQRPVEGYQPGWVRLAPRGLSRYSHLLGEDVCLGVRLAGGGVCL